MDEEVPPPVQQELIEDDFWNDNEVEEEAGLIEEDEKKAHVPSWEEEFGDELVGLPVLEEEEEFDPVGDLAYLEKLLEGKPTMVIKNSPNEDEQPKEEFDSWPVEESDGRLPLRPRTREKARRKRLDQPILRVQRWFKQKKKLEYRNNHPPHYISRIRFGPGKYNFWWSDLFKLHKTYSGFIISFLINNSEQITFTGLDRGCRKEKPPD